MVKVSVEVRSGAARFAVAVRAGSIRRATSLVRGRDRGGDYRETRPIVPEVSFVDHPAVRAGNIERPAAMAA